MNEKEQVLEQLNDITSSLMDNEKFVPYNYNILILWGVISALLFLTFEQVAKWDITYSVLYVVAIIGVVFVIESYYTKKENLKYDLERFTKTQKFIESLYQFSSIFSALLTYVFISNGMIVYSYLIWIFMIGFTNYIVGFVINNKYFTTIGMLNLVVVFVLFTVNFIFTVDVFEPNIKYIAVLFSSFGCIFIGIKSKKEI